MREKIPLLLWLNMKVPKASVDAREYFKDLLPPSIAGAPSKPDYSLAPRILVFSRADFAPAACVEELNHFISAWDLHGISNSKQVYDDLLASHRDSVAKKVAELTQETQQAEDWAKNGSWHLGHKYGP